MTVHIVWHSSSLRHDPGPNHPESPARLHAVLEALRSGPAALVWHDAEPVEERQLLAVHTAKYLETLRGIAKRGGGRCDPDTVMGPESLEAASYAAGAAVTAARLALERGPAFAPVRPPGHHATADRAMGFCLFNNIVIATRWALDEAGLDRVLIIDWDVHHGNGTQDLVESDGRIRYVSLHQWPLYPGTGREDERGVGNVFNVPRPPGLPRATYLADLRTAVSRATEAWTPDLMLISAGFDALAGDPLAGFTLEPEDYASWLAEWRTWNVPIASVLEGGYVPHRIAQAAAAHVGALA